MEDLVVWNSIPVSDMDRACKFYSHVLGLPFATPLEMDGIAMPGRAPGADMSEPPSRIVAFNLYLGGEPSQAGPTVFLGSMGDIDGMLRRVCEAGGKIDTGSTTRARWSGRPPSSSTAKATGLESSRCSWKVGQQPGCSHEALDTGGLRLHG
jgi:predicted enzyme related to lactoylglutathione lyase